MFDAKQFLEDNNIPYKITGPNTSPGYVNICCPYCGDDNYHFGFHIRGEFANCWKCGGHNIVKTIQELLDISYIQAQGIFMTYQTDYVTEHLNKDKIKTNKTEIILPGEPLPTFGTSKHHKYLLGRSFDPYKLVKEFNLYYTDHTSVDYKFRIVAPIYFNNKLVSFQARDITNKQELRYKACKKEDEIIHHKHLLYNIDNAKGDKVILCEGVTDCWRLGNNSVCTFGTSYTMEQVSLLANRFKEVYILFDNEWEAQNKAEQLAKLLSCLNVKCENIILEDYSDPADTIQTQLICLRVKLII
jgi:5S rRNA maturation endonuclease (ribonuclease M5)